MGGTLGIPLLTHSIYYIQYTAVSICTIPTKLLSSGMAVHTLSSVYIQCSTQNLFHDLCS